MNKAALTVVADNKTRVTGQANPTLTVTYTGFVNGETSSVLTTQPVLATTAATQSPVGVYPITFSTQAVAANYTITHQVGELDVTAIPKVDPVITWADPAAIVYGTSLGVNQLNATANVGGSFAYDPPAGTVLAVGTRELKTTFTPSDTAGFNTVIRTVSIVVNKANLSVTALDASRAYGAANPSNLPTQIVGMIAGDQITASGAVDGVAVGASVGEYADSIVATISDPTTKLANYNVVTTKAKLTVTKAPLTISTSAKTRSYGSPNPDFEPVIQGLKNDDNISATYSTSATTSTGVGSYDIVGVIADPTIIVRRIMR